MAVRSNSIKSGHKNVVYFTLNTIMVELEIDPEETSSQDDKYTLFCSNNKSIYSNTLTVKDDHVSGDNFLTLKFTELVSDHNYSLEIDPGAEEEPYYLFENIPMDDLINNKFTYPGSEEGEDDPDLDPVYEESEDANLPYDDSDLDDDEQLSDDWEIDIDEKLSDEWEQESDSQYYNNDDEDWERA